MEIQPTESRRRRMAKNATSRQEARGSATDSAKSSGSSGSTGGRRPGPRAESENTTDNQPEAIPEKPMALVVIAPNPKRKNSKAAGFYDKYPARLTMSDFMTARRNKDGSERVRGKDISWDADRRHILLGEEAENFPVDGTREEQAEYLASLPKTEAGFSIDEKRLIAWGFKDAPVEEKAEAKSEVAAEEATA
jgi:hypothetical protein